MIISFHDLLRNQTDLPDAVIDIRTFWDKIKINLLSGSVGLRLSVIDQNLCIPGQDSLHSKTLLKRSEAFTIRMNQYNLKLIEIGLPELNVHHRLLLRNPEFQDSLFLLTKLSGNMPTCVPFISGAHTDHILPHTGNHVDVCFQK